MKMIILALTLFPATAHAALTAEFYTYGAHDVVVSAFNKTALIFGGSDYQSMFATVATVGLVAFILRVLLALCFGGFKGDSNYFTLSVMPWLLSCAVFTGTVLPKGTLHIYDPVENKYQAVGGVPDIIITAAFISNRLERGLVDMVSTSGDPLSFQSQAGGKGFLGLYSLSKTPLQASDVLLDASLAGYIKDCVGFEISQSSGYAQELRRGTTDLLTSLAKAVNPANRTVVFADSLDAGGETMTCTAAWANIQPRLVASDALTNNLTATCAEMGFSLTTTTGSTDCISRMSEVTNGQILSGSTGLSFLRQAYVAQSLDRVFSSANSDEEYATYSVLNKASGVMNSFNTWLPYLRAVILAVTISLTPFLCLLMFTPLMGKVVKYIFASFLFITVWGVSDAVLHQFTIDYANTIHNSVRQYNMGLDMFRSYPPAAEKILAIFGLVRAAGLVVAGAVSSSVLALGHTVGSAIGGKVDEIMQTAGAAGAQMLDPGSKAAIRKSNQMSIPTETMANAYSWDQRQKADYSRMAGDLSHQLGALDEAGGMENYTDMRHGQGVTGSYRGQGDVALNQQFMKQAESMGIPREQAQMMAAATVNHGEGLAELQRLEKQGYSGEKAADTYWSGKVADHMQGRSVGQTDDFTLYRPTAQQENGRWGHVSATWQEGQLVGLQGNSVGVVDTDSIRTAYDKSFGSTLSEVRKAEQSAGESVTKSWGNSRTWSQVTAAADQLYSATSGSVDLSKSVNSTVLSSLRNSHAVDERTGQTIDKSAWAQISAGLATPKVSPLKAQIEGGASWRVTDSRGQSYVVHQSAEQARTTAENIGQTWRNSTTQVRSGQYSDTAQKALAQIESITGTKTATETASKAYQQSQDIAERRSQALANATEARTSLDRDFYSWVGTEQFGGGTSGDRHAIKHLEGLAATGQTAEINRLRSDYYTARGITPEGLGAALPTVTGPDQTAAITSVDDTLQTTAEGLHSDLAKQPNLKTSDPTAKFKKQQNVPPGTVSQNDIDAGISATKDEIQSGGTLIEARGQDIKREPVERFVNPARPASPAGSKPHDRITPPQDTAPSAEPAHIPKIPKKPM